MRTSNTIPNNVGLNENRRLLKQLSSYQAAYLAWWKERGPSEFLDLPLRLRCPTGLQKRKNWAEFKMVRPEDYRWGIFAAPNQYETIGFGIHAGEPIWSNVPSEYRKLLFEHVRIQGDVENAAIEQCGALTKTAPSLIDLRNLFQFLLEEGRHTWSMVYLLLKHFGEDGLVEAEAYLDRISGDEDNPRLLRIFNVPVDDWLSHFIFCFFTDRIGKYQLTSVTRGAFAPLAEMANFMMFEEPLHMAIGQLGLERVLYKSAEMTLEKDTLDVFPHGAIPLPVIQKYINYWITKVFDSFGHDESHRAHEMYKIGVRIPFDFMENHQNDIEIDRCSNHKIERAFVTSEHAINCIMRGQYIAEVMQYFNLWNREFEKLGLDFKLYCPHERFNREVGPCKDMPFDINGNLVASDNPQVTIANYLPSTGEIKSVNALMKRELEPSKCATWLASPKTRLSKLSQSRTSAGNNISSIY